METVGTVKSDRNFETIKEGRVGTCGGGGKENPADLGSWGVTASHLKNSDLWWKGPQWLSEGKHCWPKGLILEDSEEVKSEKKKVNVLIAVTETPTGVSQMIDINKYSTLRKLLRVTTWVKRFVDNLKARKEGKDLNVEGLSAQEITSAEKLWIKDVQSTMTQGLSFKKTQNPLGIMEMEDILVWMGRLERSHLSSEAKYPIYLPKDHRLTELVVEDCHLRVFTARPKLLWQNSGLNSGSPKEDSL